MHYKNKKKKIFEHFVTIDNYNFLTTALDDVMLVKKVFDNKYSKNV